MNTEVVDNTPVVTQEITKLPNKKSKIVFEFLIILITSMLSAFGLWIFVYPANFAPGGVDGIATMLQALTQINAGIFGFLINLPLLVIAFFILKRKYVIYTVIFMAISSATLIVLEEVGFYQYYDDTNGILAAVFSGVILGVRTGLLLKIGASSGGIDVVGSMVQAKKPYFKVESIITIIAYVITGLSFFVYNNELICILLAVVHTFVFDKTIGRILKSNRNAVELKIITKNPQELKNDIIFNLKHGATIVKAKGMYTEQDSYMVISVINIRQIPEVTALVKKYPHTFIYYSDVVGVNGNFRWAKDDIAK